MESTALDIILTAKDQASAVIKGVSGEVDNLGNSAGSIGKGFTAAGAAMTAVGGGITAFATSAVSKTAELAESTYKLSAATGMSSEQASAWISVGAHFGISADAMGGAAIKTAKAIEGLAQGTIKANTPVGQLGLQVKDAHGNMLPFNDIIGQVADKFQKMPDGAAKTAAATTLFGRTLGAQLIPVLDQGKAGIEDLEKEAQKMGTTLSSKNVSDIRTYTVAQREMTEQFEGLKVSVGEAVLPALISLTGMISKIMSAFEEMSPTLKNTIVDFLAFGGPILVAAGALTMFIGSVISGAAAIGTILPEGFAALLGPIALWIGIVIAAIVVMNQLVAAHGGWHRVLDEAKAKILAVWEPIEKYLKPSFDRLLLSIQQLWGEMQKNLLPQLDKLMIALQPEIDFLGQMATIIVEVLVVAIKVFLDVLTAIIPTIVPVLDFILGFVTTAVNAFNSMVGLIKRFITNLRDHFWVTIGEIIGFFLTLPIQIPLLIGDAIGAAIVWLMGVNWGAVFSNIGRSFMGAMIDVKNLALDAWHYVTGLNWGAILIGIGRGIANAIIDLVQGGINGALASIPGHPQVHLPHFATGTSSFSAGGAAIVGEAGPEMAIFPPGTKILNSEQTNSAMRGAGAPSSSGPNITIQAGTILATDDEIRKFAILIHRELTRTARQHNVTFPSVGVQVN